MRRVRPAFLAMALAACTPSLTYAGSPAAGSALAAVDAALARIARTDASYAAMVAIEGAAGRARPSAPRRPAGVARTHAASDRPPPRGPAPRRALT